MAVRCRWAERSCGSPFPSLPPFWCCALCPRAFPAVLSPECDLHQNRCWGAKTHGQGGTSTPCLPRGPSGSGSNACSWRTQRGQEGRTAPSCAGSWPSPCFHHGCLSDACFLTPPLLPPPPFCELPPRAVPCAPAAPVGTAVPRSPENRRGRGRARGRQRGRAAWPGARCGFWVLGKRSGAAGGLGWPEAPGSGAGGGAVPWFPAQPRRHRPPFVPQTCERRSCGRLEEAGAEERRRGGRPEPCALWPGSPVPSPP